MTTLHGAPLPKDFEDNNPLTAADFNAVKNYWVTNELPEYDPDDPDSVEIQDGDVVFVIGDPVGDSGELPGLGGWATIKEVSGNPTRYEYPAGNPEWVAFEWTGDGSLTTSGGLVDSLLVAGGMYYSTATPASTSGGRVASGILDLPADTYTCKVDVKFVHNQRGNPGSSLRRQSDNVYVMMAHRGLPYVHDNNEPFGSFADIENGLLFDGFKSSITGVEKEYGQGYKMNGSKTSDAPGNAGQVAGDAHDGAVIIRVPVANDDTKGQGSTPASVVAAVDQAKETVKQTIKRNRSKR